MKIAEIYQSRQGEGVLTGTMSVFVRTSGCNLRCRFCDTPYASWRPEGDDLAIDSILARIESFEARHVVVTGGEPMLFAELIPLCDALSQRDYHITIETAGTLFLPVVCDLMSISPKLSNSLPDESVGGWRARHERTRRQPEVLRRLIADYSYQLKFVVQSPGDLEEVEAFLRSLGPVPRDRVWLMPQARSIEEQSAVEPWLEGYCRQRGYRYCPRRQLQWYGAVRGT